MLTAPAPSERYDQGHERRHKTLTDWARQMLLVVYRWWPDRPLVAVADGTYTAISLLAHCRRAVKPITIVTHLRLDAALHKPTPLRQLGQTIARYTRRVGSSVSRRASPSRLKETTVTKIASVGKRKVCGAVAMYWRAVLTIAPHSGIGG